MKRLFLVCAVLFSTITANAGDLADVRTRAAELSKIESELKAKLQDAEARAKKYDAEAQELSEKGQMVTRAWGQKRLDTTNAKLAEKSSLAAIAGAINDITQAEQDARDGEKRIGEAEVAYEDAIAAKVAARNLLEATPDNADLQKAFGEADNVAKQKLQAIEDAKAHAKELVVAIEPYKKAKLDREAEHDKEVENVAQAQEAEAAALAIAEGVSLELEAAGSACEKAEAEVKAATEGLEKLREETIDPLQLMRAFAQLAEKVDGLVSNEKRQDENIRKLVDGHNEQSRELQRLDEVDKKVDEQIQEITEEQGMLGSKVEKFEEQVAELGSPRKDLDEIVGKMVHFRSPFPQHAEQAAKTMNLAVAHKKTGTLSQVLKSTEDLRKFYSLHLPSGRYGVQCANGRYQSCR